MHYIGSNTAVHYNTSATHLQHICNTSATHLQHIYPPIAATPRQSFAVCCSVLQFVAVGSSAWQCVAACSSAWQCVTVSCSVL